MGQNKTEKIKKHLYPDNSVISIKETRKLLGSNSNNLSDSDIKTLTKSLQNFAILYLESKNPRPP
jgi:hypothetical protein